MATYFFTLLGNPRETIKDAAVGILRRTPAARVIVIKLSGADPALMSGNPKI